MTDWLARRGRLPEETRQYVKIITGQEPERWTENTRSRCRWRCRTQSLRGRRRPVAQCRTRQGRGPARSRSPDDRKPRARPRQGPQLKQRSRRLRRRSRPNAGGCCQAARRQGQTKVVAEAADKAKPAASELAAKLPPRSPIASPTSPKVTSDWPRPPRGGDGCIFPDSPE